MKKFKCQFFLLVNRPEFLVSFLIMTMISLGIFLFNCFKYWGRDLTDIPSAYSLCIYSADSFILQPILAFILLLVVTIPFSDTYHTEKSTKLNYIVYTKSSAKVYYFSKIITITTAVIILISIPFLLNCLLTLSVFPYIGLCDASNQMSSQSQFYDEFIDFFFLPELFSYSPYLYGFCFILLLTLFLVFCAIIVFNVSTFFIKNKTLLLATPFITYCIVAIVSNIAPLFFTSGIPPALDPFSYFFAFDTHIGKRSIIIIGYFITLIITALITGRIAIKKIKSEV